MSTQRAWAYYLSGPTMVDRDGILIRFKPGRAERWTPRAGWKWVHAPYLTGSDPAVVDGGQFLTLPKARAWAGDHDAAKAVPAARTPKKTA